MALVSRPRNPDGTPKQTRRDKIALFVREYAIDHLGNTPSLGEIAREFGISRTTAHNHSLKLVSEGRAEWRDGEFILAGSEFSLPPDI